MAEQRAAAQPPEQSRPGPRPTYTLEQIAAAGAAVADRGGLAAVSMRAVAEQLGTAPASLYRYLRGKEDLIALMVDQVTSDCELPPLTGDLRSDTVALAERCRVLHHEHPWLAGLRPTSLAAGTLRIMDQLAGALAPAGLDPHRTLMAIAMVWGWIGSFAAQETSGTGLGEMVSAVQRDLGSADALPHLRALGEAAGAATAIPPAGGGTDADALFVSGIDTVLFGIVPRSAR